MPLSGAGVVGGVGAGGLGDSGPLAESSLGASCPAALGAVGSRKLIHQEGSWGSGDSQRAGSLQGRLPWESSQVRVRGLGPLGRADRTTSICPLQT